MKTIKKLTAFAVMIALLVINLGMLIIDCQFGWLGLFILVPQLLISISINSKVEIWALN